MYRFYSTLKRPTIVVSPLKTNRDGEVLQERLYIQFEDKYFETEDEIKVEALRKHPEFGFSYIEIDADTKLPKDVGYQNSRGINEVGVTKMDTKEDKQSNEVAELRSEVSQLTKLMDQFIANQSEKPAKEKTKSKTKSKTEDIVEEVK